MCRTFNRAIDKIGYLFWNFSTETNFHLKGTTPSWKWQKPQANYSPSETSSERVQIRCGISGSAVSLFGSERPVTSTKCCWSWAVTPMDWKIARPEFSDPDKNKTTGWDNKHVCILSYARSVYRCIFSGLWGMLKCAFYYKPHTSWGEGARLSFTQKQPSGLLV